MGISQLLRMCVENHMTGRLNLSLSTLDTHVVYFYSSLATDMMNSQVCSSKLTTARKRSLGQGNIFTGICLGPRMTVGHVHDRECAWQGVCVTGGMHGRGACVAGGVHCRGCTLQGCVLQGLMHGRGGMCCRGSCMAGEACVARDMHGRGHVYQLGDVWQGVCMGACMAGGMCGKGVHMVAGHA